MNDREGIEKVGGEAGCARRKDARHAAAWLLAACGFLAAGVAGGAALTAWRQDIAWAAPLAGFFAYLLTFRRGMNLWYPNVDRAWRHSPEATPSVPGRKEAADPDATIRLYYPVPAPPETSRTAWRVVR